MISGFSLQEAWRGRPQVLQLFTVPAEEGDGVRLVVNETPYNGLLGAGQLCVGAAVEPETGRYPRFRPPFATPTTFVLADHLSEVRFQYLAPSKKPGEPGLWMPVWNRGDWPAGIRIEMAPLEPSPARLQPITVTAPIYVNRKPGVKYEDR
jgi:hypothetical protein